MDCDRCRATKAFKAAAKAANDKHEARVAKAREAGFDITKTMNEWTEEEIEAYVAWKRSHSL